MTRQISQLEQLNEKSNNTVSLLNRDLAEQHSQILHLQRVARTVLDDKYAKMRGRQSVLLANRTKASNGIKDDGYDDDDEFDDGEVDVRVEDGEGSNKSKKWATKRVGLVVQPQYTDADDGRLSVTINVKGCKEQAKPFTAFIGQLLKTELAKQREGFGGDSSSTPGDLTNRSTTSVMSEGPWNRPSPTVVSSNAISSLSSSPSLSPSSLSSSPLQSSCSSPSLSYPSSPSTTTTTTTATSAGTPKVPPFASLNLAPALTLQAQAVARQTEQVSQVQLSPQPIVQQKEASISSTPEVPLTSFKSPTLESSPSSSSSSTQQNIPLQPQHPQQVNQAPMQPQPQSQPQLQPMLQSQAQASAVMHQASSPALAPQTPPIMISMDPQHRAQSISIIRMFSLFNNPEIVDINGIPLGGPPWKRWVDRGIVVVGDIFDGEGTIQWVVLDDRFRDDKATMQKQLKLLCKSFPKPWKQILWKG
jgi:hypothetical protein